jgi:hypothetical protein
MLLTQVGQARQFYSSISNDDILKGFRHEAGQLAPGDGMKGWCKSTSAVIFGQLISGMVRLGRATDYGALIEKANALFEGWFETLPPDGNARMRVYDWDKLVCGLVDLGRYSGSERAVAALRRTVAWASRTFDRSRQPAKTVTTSGAQALATRQSGTRCRKPLPRLSLLRRSALQGVRRHVALPGYWRRFAETDAHTRFCRCTHTVTSIHFSSAAAYTRHRG